ncbi:MAG: winged helix-turn-helix domain-containing protein [Acidobacteriota bacterium]|nr:winged helix-turn-helix domain-containing protein [Acidobacteriota bacterium]
MDVLDQTISQKERELDEYLARVDDPILRQLFSDISALRRTREIVAGMSRVMPAHSTPSHAASQNGHSSQVGALTQGDAAVEILRKAGRPMHLNEILKEVPRYGLNPKKTSFVSNLRKDRRQRFKIMGGNVFALIEGHNTHSPSAVKKPSTSGSGNKLTRMGFSLVGSIKEVLPTLNGEFSQPIVVNKLRERFPEAAPLIQKSSVSTTLRKLAESGLIEVTHQGIGSDPRRYRRVTK